MPIWRSSGASSLSRLNGWNDNEWVRQIPPHGSGAFAFDAEHSRVKRSPHAKPRLNGLREMPF
jgi:hypothetical protein